MAHFKRIVWLAVLGMGCCLSETIWAQSSPCGNYYQSDAPNQCARLGVFPWMVVQSGAWSVEMRAGTKSTAAVAVDIAGINGPIPPPEYSIYGRDDYPPYFAWLGEPNNGPVALAYPWTYSTWNFDGQWASLRAPERIRIVSNASCTSSTTTLLASCTKLPDALAGQLSIYFRTTTGNPSDLDKVSAKIIQTLYATDGSVVTQYSIPVIFVDQATSKWSAPIVETPLSQQRDNPAATRTAFAVGDAVLFGGSGPPGGPSQRIRISIYDEDGFIVASKMDPPQAAMLSEFLGFDLPTSAGSTEFRGTIVFEGMSGYKIAPTVLRANWPAIASVPVKAE
jgi:hypothetical protein